MRPVVAGVALAIMLPTQSFGLSVLCVESRGAGFNWSNGEWSTATYAGRQHLIKDVADDPFLNEYCTPSEPVKGEYATTSDMCFNIAEVGEERSAIYTSTCDIRHGDDGGIAYASCPGLFSDYRFIPNGEFQFTQLHTFPEAEPGPERDSLAIFVGKCSVIEP